MNETPGRSPDEDREQRPAPLFELALAPETDDEEGRPLPPEPHRDAGDAFPRANGPLGSGSEPPPSAAPEAPPDDDARAGEPPDEDVRAGERLAERLAEPAHEAPVSFWEEPRPQLPRRSLAVVVLASMIAVLLGASAGAVGTFYALRDRVVGEGVVRVSPPIADPPDEPANAAAAVAATILPSIVQIDVLGTLGQQAVGSGVIYRSDGYIVTNDHVIRGADEIRVRLSTGEQLAGVVVGSAAPAVDIAIIKVAGTSLPAATFGTTENLRVGDLAVAIGSPFGLEATVTSGVISAMHRNAIRGASVGVPDALQTDAAINPGNSGGALANAHGEVVGINTAIIGGDTGGNVGIGFAIPAEMVLRVADQIIRTGSARLAYLGIQGHSLPDEGGALIVEVPAGGPADRAGLQPDDVIVEIDGREIASFEELVSYLLSKDVGDTVAIGFLRDGQRRSTSATLAERPEG